MVCVLPFGGKVVLICEESQQILQIVSKGPVLRLSSHVRPTQAAPLRHLPSLHHSMTLNLLTINSLNPNGLPVHRLLHRAGVPVILLRNFDQLSGLANGTRRIVLQKAIRVQIVTGPSAGVVIIILRILWRQPTLHLHQFTRLQFPLQLTFCMTFSKAQGQTLPVLVSS